MEVRIPRFLDLMLIHRRCRFDDLVDELVELPAQLLAPRAQREVHERHPTFGRCAKVAGHGMARRLAAVLARAPTAMLGYALVAVVPCILVQRYNRVRLERALRVGGE